MAKRLVWMEFWNSLNKGESFVFRAKIVKEIFKFYVQIVEICDVNIFFIVWPADILTNGLLSDR